MYPPTWLATRTVTAPCKLSEYRLVPGQAVLLSSYVVHRDPRWHRNPDAFEPERWLDGGEQALSRWAYFPFGAGPRMCPGAALAMTELVLATAIIQRHARLRPPAAARAVQPNARRTLVPDGLVLKVERR